jgi:hypothetical protein
MKQGTPGLVVAFLVAALCGVGAVAAFAHHSFPAQYDGTKRTVLTGYVTKVEWRNPHVYFYLDVEDESGTIENWAFEMGAPNGLQRQGWNRSSMKLGDVLEVEGSLARDGSNLVNASTVKFAETGQRLFAGSSEAQTSEGQ